jgi:hypothetical protein
MTEGTRSHGGPVPPYGTAIQEAVASGDLTEMKQLARQAERFLMQYGDVRAALEVLKIEIRKLEKAKRK